MKGLGYKTNEATIKEKCAIAKGSRGKREGRQMQFTETEIVFSK